MRTTLSISTWSVLVAALVLAGPARATDQTRELPAFQSITSQGALHLIVNVGQKQAVLVSGSDAMLARLETKVIDNTLVLSTTERKQSGSDDKLRVSISVEQLQQFQMEGAGKTDLNNLSGEHFRLNYQGVGLLNANGKVQNLTIKAEGVGAIHARELEARNVDVRLSGVGSVQVRATESLRAKVEGIGTLTYYGKPSRISKSVDGIGKVTAGD